MVLLPTGGNLVWQEWEGVYVVYQPSSAETHVFNETTALILSGLEKGPLSILAIRDRTEVALGVEQGELVNDDFTFAIQRLEELGLIDCLDEPFAIQ